MTVEELKERERKLALNIANLINDFHISTLVRVKTIELGSIWSLKETTKDGRPHTRVKDRPVLLKVEVGVEL